MITGADVVEPGVPYDLPNIVEPTRPTRPQTETITKIEIIPQIMYFAPSDFDSDFFPTRYEITPKRKTRTARLTRIGIIELIVL